MKYRAGDKFIIEIWNMAKEQGLYTIKGFNTLVFDERGLDRLEQIHEHDGCNGCTYMFLPFGEEPCGSCCNNYTSKFEPLPEKIQVGDEVEFISPNTQEIEYGIVLQKHDKIIRAVDGNFVFRSWDIEDCHRTGKTYPELIKALEQLPKDGE